MIHSISNHINADVSGDFTEITHLCNIMIDDSFNDGDRVASDNDPFVKKYDKRKGTPSKSSRSRTTLRLRAGQDSDDSRGHVRITTPPHRVKPIEAQLSQESSLHTERSKERSLTATELQLIREEALPLKQLMI